MDVLECFDTICQSLLITDILGHCSYFGLMKLHGCRCMTDRGLEGFRRV